MSKMSDIQLNNDVGIRESNQIKNKPSLFIKTGRIGIVVLIIITFILLIIYLITMKKIIIKELVSLPTYGYLYAIKVSTFQQTEGSTTGTLKGVTNSLNVLLGRNVEVIALHYPEMFDDDGKITQQHKNDLTELISNANAIGISVGLIVEKNLLIKQNFKEDILNYDLISFFHTIKHLDNDDEHLNMIENFNTNLLNNNLHNINRTNNIITCDEYTTQLYGQIIGLRSYANAIIMLKNKPSINEQNVDYPNEPRLMFTTECFNPSETIDFSKTTEIQQALKLSSTLFISNSSILLQGEDIYKNTKNNYLDDWHLLSKHSNNTLKFVTDFSMLKNNTNLWEGIDKTKNFMYIHHEMSVTGLFISLNLLEENVGFKNFSKIILLQNTDITQPYRIFNLIDTMGIKKGNIGHVLLSYPEPNNFIYNELISIDHIKLERGQTVMFALYKEDILPKDTKVSSEWPMK